MLNEIPSEHEILPERQRGRLPAIYNYLSKDLKQKNSPAGAGTIFLNPKLYMT
jgi:hypothetical protein